MSLYQAALGGDFAVLPQPLQAFHALEGRHVLLGWVEVSAPESFGARILARCLGTPLVARQGAIRFELIAGQGGEVWTRHFPGKTMTSALTLRNGRVVEHLGPARLTFALEGCRQKLKMQLVGLHFLGLPCPRWLLPVVMAEETASAGRLHFRVQASLPLIGLVACYQGHLDLPDGAAS